MPTPEASPSPSAAPRGALVACALAWALIGLGALGWMGMSLRASFGLRPGTLPAEIYGPVAAITVFSLGCLLLAWGLLRPRSYLRALAYGVTVPFTVLCAGALAWCVVLLLGQFNAVNVGVAAVPLAGLVLAGATRRLVRGIGRPA
jgi:hypothetical protein